MQKNNFIKLLIAVAVSELAGIIGSLFTAPAVSSSWYSELAKPALNPPSWVFGPVWVALYALMGIAAFFVWKKEPDRRDVKIALGIFLGQLFLNTLWSIIFFGSPSLAINGFNNIGLAFIEIIFLWLAILATIIAFAKISKTAAWLLLPYIIWVSFAAYLNYSIWQLNTATGSRQTACTEEAKLCSDGSAVGRTGPKCEFAACPKEDLIRIEYPLAYSEISSPLTVTGTARGYWFFEASFPVKLIDAEGNTLVQTYAQAEGEWMTENFVPFSSVIQFTLPKTTHGTLILEKDNPSGLPEYADEIRIPVVFRAIDN